MHHAFRQSLHRQALRFVFGFGGKLFPSLAGQMAWSQFCTPASNTQSLSQREERVFSRAERLLVPFRGLQLTAYRWQTQFKPEISDIAIERSQRTVLFVHGWGGRSSAFIAFIDPLLKRGFNVVTFDAPAHGSSPGAQTNLVDFAAGLQAVAKWVAPVHALVGHSFGGMVSAFATAGRKPLPGATPIDRLVIIGTPNRLSDLIEQFSLQLQVPERAVDYIRHQVQILVDRHLNEQTTRSFLEDTDIPTLVIHDRQDADTPFSNGEAIAAYSHRSHLVSTDSLGHQRILRSPQVIRTVASFLGGQSPDPRTAQQ